MARRTPLSLARVFSLVLALGLASSCSDSGTEPEPEDPVVTTVVVSPGTTTLSSTGATTQLDASVRDQNGRTMSGQTVSWSSNDESVATVSASGLVTAVGDGDATITATVAGKNGSASIEVAIRGSLRVVTETTGDPGALDPDGYALNIGSTGATVGTNETKTIDGLRLGDVTVELVSIAGNCALTSAESVDVTITEEETAEAAFTLTCETLAGMYRWATEVGGEMVGTALGADGTIYAATNANQASLFALAPDGGVLWSFNADEYITGAPAIAADGTIHFGTGAGTLVAVNPDGTEKWSYDVGGVFGAYGSPVVTADGTVYMSNDGFLDPPTLHAVNADGTEKWTFSDAGSSGFTLAVAADGTVYLAAYGEEQNDGLGRVIALDSDGAEQWTYAAEGPALGMAIAGDGTIYVGVVVGESFEDGTLVALNPDGSEAWTAETGGGISGEPSIAADGTIYAATNVGADGVIYAVNPDGTQAWTAALAGCPADDIGVTVGADGTIYAGVDGCVFGGVGILHAFDASGTELWQFEVNGEFKVIRGSSPIADDGTAYVTSMLTGEVYAVKTESMGLAASSWPKSGRDNRNSGDAGGGE